MADTTEIAWALATFNPWIGCMKVAPGCLNCYAEADFDKRRHFAKWGANGTRVKTSDAYWKKPLKWNKAAECIRSFDCANGQHSDACPQANRPRVFCASLADVFEEIGSDHVFDHKGNAIYRAFPEVTRPSNDPADHYRVGLDHLRRDLFSLIDQTPNLDWLLLTKRPENIRRMWPRCSYDACLTGDCPHDRQSECDAAGGVFERDNVWLLASVSDQPTADAAIPELLKCRDLAPVLGVSYEPALGPWNIWKSHPPCSICGARPPHGDCEACAGARPLLDWLIYGGESGSHARPADVAWARSTVEQCLAAGVPVFVKQLGAWAIAEQRECCGAKWISHYGPRYCPTCGDLAGFRSWTCSTRRAATGWNGRKTCASENSRKW